ncbi:MAG: glycoside hydrolase family 3 C-terminal domain-containing protein [Clostridiales bacterium]|nr:glycoside hydrolase family 3 C-terminal domain-containing protein [Clostridiales bacterium]
MLDINMDDVISAIQSCSTYLIVLGVIVVLAIIAMIVCRKMSKDKKFMIRAQSGAVMIVALVVVVNLIIYGPMYTLVSLAMGEGSISDETTAEANELVEEITDEGIVLLENDGILPLSTTAVNVFGWASTSPCYGGTGSGALNDAYEVVTLLQGLENAGISTNTELTEFYTNYHDSSLPDILMWAQDWTLPEPNVSEYSDELIANAQAFSDTAIIVITRVGGEGADLPTDMTAVVNGTYNSAASYNDTLNEGSDWDEGDTYLDLTNQEEEMIALVCENFDNVIVVYNGANTMELGWVEDYEQIQGVIWCPGTGQTGFNALGDILTGAVNPSGKTADTFVYDLTATPYFNNIGSTEYTNLEEFYYEDGGYQPCFVNYVESIYVGYRFYETAAAEGLIDYDTTVQYPFGYGLSYTEFTQEISNVSTTDGVITFDVTVTNTGSVAGKDVVEVYYNPPYYNGGIEKSTANLVTYAKTDTLEPGTSETVSVSFNAEDMASYDTYGAGCYVLEAGEYTISINSDSHTVLDSFTYAVDETVTYDEDNPRSTDQVAAVNQFDYAEGDVTYLSRANGFANYAEAVAAPASTEMSEDLKAEFVNNSNAYEYVAAQATGEEEMPTTGAKNGVELADLRGLDYDDPLWDDLLDEMSVSDMNSLISLGGYQTAAVSSIGKVQTVDCDGPASINNNFTGEGSVGFPSAVIIANSWNADLALAFGESIGKMADEMDVSGWYAPAMNNHRSAFAGRNFEYYSEDGVLAGTMAANALIGAEEYGVYGYIKHFALNDQETSRSEMLCTFSSEQAIREIYLKPFEIAVKDGGAKAVMAAFSYVGTYWASGNYELCTVVLRNEWGFVGFVETDYFAGAGYMNSDQAIYAGTDLMLATMDMGTNNVSDQTSAFSLQNMRTACHNILYVTVNSRAYAEENLSEGMAGWQIALIVVDVIVAVIVVGCEVLIFRGYKKRKANAE